VELISKLVDGKFPDYTRVIPTGNRNIVVLERESLRQALLRAAILSNEKFRGVRWVLAQGTLKIVSSNAEQEEAEEVLEVPYEGDALDIGFNVNYLLDVLNNVDGTQLECSFGDASSSALLCIPRRPSSSTSSCRCASSAVAGQEKTCRRWIRSPASRTTTIAIRSRC
jgi:DNA polymerase-3 subunit beta